MAFKTKLIVAYSVLIVVLTITFSVVYLQYMSNFYMDKAKTDARALSERMSKQMDELVRPMEFLSLHFLSDFDNWNAIYTLSTVNRSTPAGQKYANEARSLLQRKMYAYSIDRNFSRFSFFDDSGDLISSSYRTESKTHFVPGQEIEPYLERAIALNGQPLLIPTHPDTWSVSEPRAVFSLLRAVRSMDEYSYLEVQRSQEELENIFNIETNPNASVIVLTDYGEVLYTNISNPATRSYFTDFLATSPGEPFFLRHPETGREMLAASSQSDYTGLRTFLIQDTSFLQDNIDIVRNLMLTLSVTMVLVSILYIYIMSNRLTKPMRSLRKQIESTSLFNLDHTWTPEDSYDEIEALNRSYSDMLARLKESITRENRIALLNAQANFDSLQAQVNPHFLFNILNIISNRGMENHDETICDICDCLAAMLRYSTNTKESQATMFDELAYLENYIYLLKQRYEHKLEYSIDVSEEIYGQKVPRILLQQLVENSINHAFSNGVDQMRIDVKGYAKNGWWYITVSDNGKGFDEKKLEELEGSFAVCREDILHNYTKPAAEIGGLGLSNLYCRMLLIFRDDFVFRMNNTPAGGAIILIGAKMRKSGEGTIC